MDARLIEDDMRELGETVLDVLNAVAADQGPATRLVGFPKGKLANPTGLLHDAICNTKSLEHLHRAAGDAVGLADQEAARFLLDDAGCDIGEGSKLGGESQTGGTAADDLDVDLRGKSVRGSCLLVPEVCFEDMRIAGPEPVEMELHRTLVAGACGGAVWRTPTDGSIRADLKSFRLPGWRNSI